VPNDARHPHVWPTTHWSLVGRAGSGTVEDRRRALSALVQIYIPVLRWHLLTRRGIRFDRVDDFLQEFLLSKILEKEILQLADRGRGNFRTFLATALDRFVINQIRDQSAAKRGGFRRGEVEEDSLPPAHTLVPGNSFDYAWARQVIGQAIRRMQRQCAANHRDDIWRVFRGRVMLPALRQAEPISYAALVEECGLESASQASNILVSANRMFVRALRQTLAVYQETESEIDDEIRDLWAAVSRGAPRRARR